MGGGAVERGDAREVTLDADGVVALVLAGVLIDCGSNRFVELINCSPVELLLKPKLCGCWVKEGKLVDASGAV